MDSNVITEPLAPESSTIVEPRQHNENPSANAHKEPDDAPEAKVEKDKPESRMDTIKRAMKDIEGKEPKDAKAEVKADDGEAKAKNADEKAPAEKQEARTETEVTKPLKPSEGRKIIEAPSRFLPRAKELWNNVPHEVRAEWQRSEQERDNEINQYRESKQFADELTEYRELAKQSNTTIKQSLDNYVKIERTFAEDPAQGFKAIMQNMQISPPQAISHILRAFNVTPQQLAEHIQRDPNYYTALNTQQQRAPQQQNYQQPQKQTIPEVESLKQQVAQMQADRVANDVIRPFANEYPEYYQHEPAIAKVLESGIIDQIHGPNLSPRDKLEAALFMVAPHVGRSAQSFQPSVQEEEQSTSQPAVDLRGTKSIKGSPNPGTDVSQRKRGKMTREDAFNAAWSELGLR